jgi:hypothetical protein
MSVSLIAESGSSGPDAVRTISMPMTPKMTDAMMNMFVAIFCIGLVYQTQKPDIIVGCMRGWGGGIRTPECRHQKPMPYHLATPQ